MGKIGDLFVRLGLKSDGLKKGIQSAINSIKSFGKSISNIKAGAIMAWQEIGRAVIGFTKNFLSHTNKLNDAWQATMNSMKAAYHSAVAEMSNYKPDFSSFKNFFKNEWKWIKKLFGNAKEAGDAAAEMTKAFDAEFELVNSVKLQRGAIQQELNELYIMMRDTTLSPQQRKAAAERYKALLQPIADAEVRVYSNMLKEAVKAWQAGNELDREYSVAELTEFFTKIGTEYEKMQEKFPDLMRVYETRKGDAQNQIIFDTLAKLQQAVNQMSDIDRQLSRVTLSINKAGAGTTSKNYLGMGKLDALGGISAGAESLSAPGLMTDEWLSEQIANGQAYGEWYKNMVNEVAYLNGMLESSMVSAFSNGMQAFTDMLFGIEGADASQVMAAVLQPIAQTATQLGEMLIAEGIAIEAFKDSLKSLNPYVAIAAGVALVAVGAALTSGIKKLAGGPNAGAGVASSGAGGATNPQNYESTLTVQIEGRLEGADIVLAAKRTQDNWGM